MKNVFEAAKNHFRDIVDNQRDEHEAPEIKKMNKVCREKYENFRDENFPGAQPVSFERSKGMELNKSLYAVCEKTDGFRYFFL